MTLSSSGTTARGMMWSTESPSGPFLTIGECPRRMASRPVSSRQPRFLCDVEVAEERCFRELRCCFVCVACACHGVLCDFVRCVTCFAGFVEPINAFLNSRVGASLAQCGQLGWVYQRNEQGSVIFRVARNREQREQAGRKTGHQA